MKGFINVKCVVGKDNNTGEQKVTTYCIIQNMESKYHSKKDLSSIKVMSSREMKFDRLQTVALRRKMIDKLEDKGGILFPACPAEFVYGTREDGSHYYAVFANIATEDKPEYKSFYLSNDNVEYIESFKLQYEFTETDIKDPEALEDNE